VLNKKKSRKLNADSGHGGQIDTLILNSMDESTNSIKNIDCNSQFRACYKSFDDFFKPTEIIFMHSLSIM
jgi:hypothetical protein